MQFHSLVALLSACLLVPGAWADTNHDGDPLSDDAEGIACGSTQFRALLTALGGQAGTCSGFDYDHPNFGDVSCAGPSCSATVAMATGVPLTGDVDVPSVLLLPVGVPSVGPIPVGPFGSTVVTVAGYPRGTQEYCFQVTPATGSPPPPACVASSLLHGTAPPTGDVPLGEVPQQPVGPTPDVPPGSFGSTPSQHAGETSLDASLVAYWDEGRLHRVVSFGQFEAWDPVDLQDPAQLSWWKDNGQQTRIDVLLTVRDENGVALLERTTTLPHIGQAYAALARSP